MQTVTVIVGGCTIEGCLLLPVNRQQDHHHPSWSFLIV
jgi:hypothetical protein